MVPHCQCALISLEEPTHSTSEEADLITEHTETLLKEQRRHTVMHSLRTWRRICTFLLLITGLQQGCQSYKPICRTEKQQTGRKCKTRTAGVNVMGFYSFHRYCKPFCQHPQLWVIACGNEIIWFGITVYQRMTSNRLPLVSKMKRTLQMSAGQAKGEMLAFSRPRNINRLTILMLNYFTFHGISC